MAMVKISMKGKTRRAG